ncbi:MAG: DUF3084 domain-containing protein [Selenomonadaceae bacterium]|nr:DUF3084 domain-containing protein [Selenomonadaceae bacterium]
MYGVLLIVVLIITGGVVAFIGDRLGTKIGKKRLSIFGLRPRHTSIVITIFTGICITTLTFGVMAAASENVRTALFGMEELNRNMQKTRQDLDKAFAGLASAQREQEETNAALKQSKDEMQDLREQQKELEAESQRLQEGNRLLEMEKEELTRRNDELAVKNGTLEQSNASLAASNEELASDNQRLEKRTEDLRQGLISIREGDIVFRANEVVASGVIRGNRSKEEVGRDFEALANLASRNISERLGANASDNDIWIYQPEYDAAIAEIAGSDKDSIVRLMAAGNLLRGEPVRVRLEVYPNSIIYGKDEFILACAYNLRGDEDKAEGVVMDFLHQINAEAVRKGILADPISGSVGIIEGDQVYGLVETLQSIHGDVALSAYARFATDAMGPLRLNVKLEQLSNE